MFTSGQKIFALVFIISFLVLIGFQYYKDRNRDKDLFKGTYIVLIAVVAIMVAYVLLNKVLH